MLSFDLHAEKNFNPERHIENVLASVAGGDVSVATWEPHQTSPYHCHPEATEIYYCVEGGGVMRTPERDIDVTPGSFVLHPPGELHEYINGGNRSVLFRIRYGGAMYSRAISWDGNPQWNQNAADREYFSVPATPG